MRRMIVAVVVVCLGHAARSQSVEAPGLNLNIYDTAKVKTTQFIAEVRLMDNISHVKPETIVRKNSFGATVSDDEPRKFRHQLLFDMSLTLFPNFGDESNVRPHLFCEVTMLRTYIGMKSGIGMTLARQRLSLGVIGGNYYRIVDEYEAIKFRTKNVEHDALFGGYAVWNPEMPLAVFASHVFEKSVENVRGYTKASVSLLGEPVSLDFVWESFIGYGFGVSYHTPNGKFTIGISTRALQDGDQHAQRVIGNDTGSGCAIHLSTRAF